MEKPSSHQERARLRNARTANFYHHFVAAYDASGLTVAQYCRKHHVGQSTFYKFQKQLKSNPPNPQSKNNSPIPTMVRVLPSSLHQHGQHPFEIQLPSGAIFRMTHFDSQIIAALIPLLSGSLP
jgi:hypothetical protein